MSKFIVGVILTFLITGCSGLYVKSDYDREFDFNSLSTFSVLHSAKNDSKDFTRDRINRILSKYFKDHGYTQVSKENANFYVLFHFNVQTKQEIETNYEMMMLRPRSHGARGNKTVFYNSPYLFSPLLPNTRVITNTYEYEEAQLNIEILDVKSNTIIWQGIAKDNMSDISSYEDIEKIVNELFKDMFVK